MDALLISFYAILALTVFWGAGMVVVSAYKIAKRYRILRERRNSLPPDDGMIHATPNYSRKYPELRLKLW